MEAVYAAILLGIFAAIYFTLRGPSEDLDARHISPAELKRQQQADADSEARWNELAERYNETLSDMKRPEADNA